MIPLRIPDATRYLGAPEGWKPEVDGDCIHLAVRDMDHGGVNFMVSIWEPTPDELARLNAGASVVLSVVGHSHPPVAVDVGEAK